MIVTVVAKLKLSYKAGRALTPARARGMWGDVVDNEAFLTGQPEEVLDVTVHHELEESDRDAEQAEIAKEASQALTEAQLSMEIQQRAAERMKESTDACE